MLNPYRAPKISDDAGLHYVEGPGSGFGYHSSLLFPEQRLSTEADAQAAAICCNEAYRQGYAKAQRDIREALGIK